MTKKKIEEMERKIERLKRLCEDLIEQQQAVLEALWVEVVNDSGDEEAIEPRIALKAIMAGEDHHEY